MVCCSEPIVQCPGEADIDGKAGYLAVRRVCVAASVAGGFPWNKGKPCPSKREQAALCDSCCFSRSVFYELQNTSFACFSSGVTGMGGAL